MLQGSNGSQLTAYNLKVVDTQDTFDTFIILSTIMIVIKTFLILGSGAIIGGKHGPCGFAILWLATDVTLLAMAITTNAAELELNDETLSLATIDLNSHFVPLIKFADCSDPVFAYSFSMIDESVRVPIDRD